MILGPAQFNIFTNDLDNRKECTLSKPDDDIRPKGAADKPEGCDAIHRALDRLEQRAERNLMNLTMGNANPGPGEEQLIIPIELEANWLESNLAE